MHIPPKEGVQPAPNIEIGPTVFGEAELTLDRIRDIFDDKKNMEWWLSEHAYYPSDLKEDYIHKVVFFAGKEQCRDGPNGDKNSYLAWPSYHIDTHYVFNIKSVYHPFMLPRFSFFKAWKKATPCPYDKVRNILIEMHICKKNKKIYEIKYLCLVEQVANGEFKRVKEMFNDPMYARIMNDISKKRK